MSLHNLKLNVSSKPESQDICFIPNGDYGSVINKFKPQSFSKGNIVDLSGKTLGTHNGIINFTIGQRKGIKISSEKPLYVIKIDAKKNEVIVGPREALAIKIIFLRDLNILENFKENEEVFVKIRSTGNLVKSKVRLKKNSAEVELSEVEYGVSPGQACVFYKKTIMGDKVLGGGWISKTTKNNLLT